MELGGINTIIWSMILNLFLLTSASSSLGGGQLDKLSLLALKAEMNDSLGILSSWNESLHVCEWSGITCGRKHQQRVTVFDLQSSQLKGRLSYHIGNLSFLRVLNLQNNSFSHTIPEEIGSLSRLQVLNLGRNNLTGEIPACFGNLSFLHMLSVEQNNLVGGIPHSLGKLKGLTFIALGMNNLEGTIPPSMYNNLSSIKHISVLGNQLHGTLPLGLGHTIFPRLETFRFHMNQFSGPIPNTISNASNLSEFGISKNSFSGKVPSLARMTILFRLEMDDNNLGSEDGDLNFVSSLVNCTKLERLGISGNHFQGALPGSISNLSTKLKVMRLGRNQIRGSIPMGISNLINLGVLELEANLLTGSIPSSVGKLTKLYNLVLDHNQLSGAIPSSLGNLPLLSRLVLMSNNLQGGIPQSLGECRNLLVLVLSQNNLTGPIPSKVIGSSTLSQLLVLDLSNNHLTGSIPAEVAKLENLISLNVSENKLSGPIPESLGSCISLASLRLEGNLLGGTIPESLGNLRGTKELDLSRNNLYGVIPNTMERLFSMRNLNLSFNVFEGAVPLNGIFQNTSAFSIKGNARLCGGKPQLRLPPCNHPEEESIPKQKIRQKKLRQLEIVSIFSVGFLVLILALYLLLHRRRRVKPVSNPPRVKPVSNPPLEVSHLKVSYENLLKATVGFSSRNLIGAGSFGSVYRGILDQEERIVAVKVLNPQSSRENFIAECEALKNLRHRNIVKLLTACASIDFQGNDFKALVYEFMINGSLEEWLHSSADRLAGAPFVQGHLILIQRITIAIDIANALDYLHNFFHRPMVHCDLKPSNIFLDNDMNAVVGDFGIARYLSDSHESAFNTKIGSIGYIAPEYGMGSPVSTYGDIFSYGILLLEMITGKRPTNDLFKDGLNLHKFVRMTRPEDVKEICDPVLLQSKETSSIINARRQRVEECLISLVRIGVACSADLPKKRMEIGDVLAELCLIRDLLTGSKMPGEHMVTA